MCVVSGRGAVGHDHVVSVQLLDGELGLLRGEVLRVVAAHLQEPLRPGRGVLWAHALHPVGEQHDQPGLPHPLGLARGDELVDDALRRVGEVPELALPQHQGVGVGHGVAQLEAEDAVFREGGVADAVGRLVGVEVGQGLVGRPVLGLVVQDVVPGGREDVVEGGDVLPVGEGAPLHVLAGEADMDAILQQGAEGKGLGHGPVHLTVHHHLAPGQVSGAGIVQVPSYRAGANLGGIVNVQRYRASAELSRYQGIAKVSQDCYQEIGVTFSVTHYSLLFSLKDYI